MFQYIKKDKDHVPVELKNIIWHKYSIYPLHREITQCRTCNNLVLMPSAIRHLNDVTYDIKEIYIDGKRKPISGVAEYGHIISENNGGKVEENNLIIQCKTCNTRQNTKNIDYNQLITDYEMLDVDTGENILMGEKYDICQRICRTGGPCKNKPLFNRRFCHIHLEN
tara:strand:- start:371 stop:871 length:501 start_codon:yes stop_codon:yes gene_type:complete